MAKAYTKEYLVSSVLWKYQTTSFGRQGNGNLAKLLDQHFDAVGKEAFRKHCSITPDFLKLYEKGSKNGLDFLDLECYNGNHE